jgi:hypothetical protein
LSAFSSVAGKRCARRHSGRQGYIQEISGVNLLPFMYLGAKHMMTGPRPPPVFYSGDLAPATPAASGLYGFIKNGYTA